MLNSTESMLLLVHSKLFFTFDFGTNLGFKSYAYVPLALFLVILEIHPTCEPLVYVQRSLKELNP